MRGMVDGRVPDTILKTIFFEQIPQSLHDILIINSEADVSKLAVLADRVMEFRSPQISNLERSNVATSASHSRAGNDESKMAALQHQLTEVTHKLTAMQTNLEGSNMATSVSHLRAGNDGSNMATSVIHLRAGNGGSNMATSAGHFRTGNDKRNMAKTQQLLDNMAAMQHKLTEVTHELAAIKTDLSRRRPFDRQSRFNTRRSRFRGRQPPALQDTATTT